MQLEDASRGLQYLHSMDLAHGHLKGVRFSYLLPNNDLTLVQGNVLISDNIRACLVDVGLTRVAGDLGSTSASSQAPSFSGANTGRWCPPELLDPERFESKGGGPTKEGDVYSMAMTIYEVSSLRNESGRSVEVALGSNGQNPVLRAQ